MIKIENTETVGWEHAIRGMRNPMNSWDKSDSSWSYNHFTIGDNDLTLMKKLAKAGTDHRKFMRMIVVYCDITAPMYWWKEFDTYKVGVVRNSCSTMHKIHDKEFEISDFSVDQLFKDSKKIIGETIAVLNGYREQFLETHSKDDWWQMIQLLPSSYNQRSTVMLNYEVLANMYHSRKNHKLDEWKDFCKWIENLPYSELITGGETELRIMTPNEMVHKLLSYDEDKANLRKELEDYKKALILMHTQEVCYNCNYYEECEGDEVERCMDYYLQKARNNNE